MRLLHLVVQLSLGQARDVTVAFLQQNGYPPGTQPLTYEAAEKSRVPLRYYGK